MTYIVMRARGAKDWFNGQPLYAKNAGAIYGLEAPPHLPRRPCCTSTVIRSADRVHKEMVNEIANLAFLTKKANIKISASDPLAYLAEVKKTYPGRPRSSVRADG